MKLKKSRIIFDSKHFLRDWLIMGFAVWPIALAAAIVVALTCWIIGNHISISLFGLYYSAVLVFDPAAFFVAICGGATIGRITGALQRSVMRRRLEWDDSMWLRASLIGGALGGGLPIILDRLMYQPIDDYYALSALPDFTWMPIYVVCLSTMQAIVLRRRVNGSWVWVLANLVGGLVLSGLVVKGDHTLEWLWFRSDNPENLCWLLGIFTQAAITGGALLWLFNATPVSVHKKKSGGYDFAE